MALKKRSYSVACDLPQIYLIYCMDHCTQFLIHILIWKDQPNHLLNRLEQKVKSNLPVNVPGSFHLRGQLLIVYHSIHWPKGKEATQALESTHCFMLLHHMHSELLLVHSLHAVRRAHGVRHCLALWFAGNQAKKGHWSARIKDFAMCIMKSVQHYTTTWRKSKKLGTHGFCLFKCT